MGTEKMQPAKLGCWILDLFCLFARLGRRLVSLVGAKTEDEARAIMETLPLAKDQLMETEYIPVGPLMPLRASMGPGPQRY